MYNSIGSLLDRLKEVCQVCVFLVLLYELITQLTHRIKLYAHRLDCNSIFETVISKIFATIIHVGNASALYYRQNVARGVCVCSMDDLAMKECKIDVYIY